MHRVAVTGLEIICAMGKDLGEFWRGLVECHSGIRPIQAVDTSSLHFHSGAVVWNYDPAQHFDGTHQEFLDRFAQFAMHGHALGAAGAIEAVATLLALHHGIIPPTINFTVPDPGCNLNLVVNRPQPASVDYELSNSFAFGGLNAVLAFRAWRS